MLTNIRPKLVKEAQTLDQTSIGYQQIFGCQNDYYCISMDSPKWERQHDNYGSPGWGCFRPQKRLFWYCFDHFSIFALWDLVEYIINPQHINQIQFYFHLPLHFLHFIFLPLLLAFTFQPLFYCLYICCLYFSALYSISLPHFLYNLSSNFGLFKFQSILLTSVVCQYPFWWPYSLICI